MDLAIFSLFYQIAMSGSRKDKWSLLLYSQIGCSPVPFVTDVMVVLNVAYCWRVAGDFRREDFNLRAGKQDHPSTIGAHRYEPKPTIEEDLASIISYVIQHLRTIFSCKLDFAH